MLCLWEITVVLKYEKSISCRQVSLAWVGGRTIPSSEDAEDDIALALLLELEGELEGLEVGVYFSSRLAKQTQK